MGGVTRKQLAIEDRKFCQLMSDVHSALRTEWLSFPCTGSSRRRFTAQLPAQARAAPALARRCKLSCLFLSTQAHMPCRCPPTADAAGLFVPCTPTAATVDGGSRCCTSLANYSPVDVVSLGPLQCRPSSSPSGPVAGPTSSTTCSSKSLCAPTI